MKKIVFFFLIFTFSIQLYAQLNQAKLDSLYASLEKNNKAMLSMCLSKNGRPIYHKGIGYIDIEANKKPDINSMYHIGSISKMFTAVMIFQLIDEKKLSLETTLDTFYPTIQNSKKITIANLLNH